MALTLLLWEFRRAGSHHSHVFGIKKSLTEGQPDGRDISRDNDTLVWALYMFWKNLMKRTTNLCWPHVLCKSICLKMLWSCICDWAIILWSEANWAALGNEIFQSQMNHPRTCALSWSPPPTPTFIYAIKKNLNCRKKCPPHLCAAQCPGHPVAPPRCEQSVTCTLKASNACLKHLPAWIL